MVKSLRDLNMNQNEVQNAVAHRLASAPSTPVEGQEYYNNTDKKKYIYNGTSWVEETAQGTTYTWGDGLQEDTATNTVSVKIASVSQLGGVTIGNYINVRSSDGKISVQEASQELKGVIEIATDSEAIAETDTTRAVTPYHLRNKIDKIGFTIDNGSSNYLTWDSANTKLSANVDTTVTSSSTNLITSGAVDTAINTAITGAMKYRGQWATTASTTDYSALNSFRPMVKGNMFYVSGTGCTIDSVEYKPGDYIVFNTECSAVTTIITSMIDKIDNTESADLVKLDATQTLTNKTISASSNSIVNLDVTNFASGVVRTTVGASGTATDNALATEKAIRDAIDSVSVAVDNVTIDKNASDQLQLKDGSSTTGITPSKFNSNYIELATSESQSTAVLVSKLKLQEVIEGERSATATLTNKTIDANGTGNSITNLETADFASGVVQTTVRSVSSASDTALATEKAVRTELDYKTDKFTETSPAMTSTGGVCTWSITNTLQDIDVIVQVFEVSTGDDVLCDISKSASSITVKINSSTDLTAGLYKAVVIG